MDKNAEAKTYRVVGILTPSRVVLNCGTDQGITFESKFRVYAYGEEMKDPDTKEPLERVYIPRGSGTVVVLQKKICTIQSDARSYSSSFTFLDRKAEVEPFDNARMGDFADLVRAKKADE
jgi:hypothetical protein